jgi:hypothetical protein
MVESKRTFYLSKHDFPLNITRSGKYILTENVKVRLGKCDHAAITICADNVTVDLNGFTLAQRGPGEGYGIYFKSQHLLTVQNGTLYNFGTFAIRGENDYSNVTFKGLRVFRNGQHGYKETYALPCCPLNVSGGLSLHSTDLTKHLGRNILIEDCAFVSNTTVDNVDKLVVNGKYNNKIAVMACGIVIVGATGVSIKKTEVTDTVSLSEASRGIHLPNCREVVVEDVVIRDTLSPAGSTGLGIGATGHLRSVARRCTVFNTVSGELQIPEIARFSAGIAFPLAENVLVEDSFVSTVHGGSHSARGIMAGRSSNTVLKNTLVQDVRSNLETPPASVGYFMITNENDPVKKYSLLVDANTFENIKGPAFWIRGLPSRPVSKSLIANNILSDVGSVGLDGFPDDAPGPVPAFNITSGLQDNNIVI